MPYDENGNWVEPAGPDNYLGTGHKENYGYGDAAKSIPGRLYNGAGDALGWAGGKIDDAVTWISGGGPTTVARYGDWDESQMQSNRNAQESARGQQGWLSEQYRKQIMGHGPSVAENQMRAGQERAMLGQLAMARSGGGPLGNQAAQYSAQANLAQQSQAANRDAATLRAQEQLAAMQNYGQLSGQMRGQDIDMFGGEASWQKAKADSFNSWANAQATADESAKSRKGSGLSGLFSAGASLAGMAGIL